MDLRVALIATVVMFCAIFIAQPVRAQDYIPLLQEGNQWNVLHMTGEPGNWRHKTTNVYRLSEDTVIEGKQYIALLVSGDKEAARWDTAGFIREDAVAKKVYYRQRYWSYNDAWERIPNVFPEHLLYDFDVSIGDTVITTIEVGLSMSVRNIVDKIDSVEIGGRYHKRITVLSSDSISWCRKEPNEWIEGVGNTLGLLYTNIPIPCSCIYQLLAFIQNGEAVYNPFGYDTDFIWEDTSSEPVENAPPVTVFASGRTLRILYADAGDYAVDVFSIAGTHLLHRECSENEVAVSLPAVPEGIYVVRITSGTYSLSKKIRLN